MIIAIEGGIAATMPSSMRIMRSTAIGTVSAGHVSTRPPALPPFMQGRAFLAPASGDTIAMRKAHRRRQKTLKPQHPFRDRADNATKDSAVQMSRILGAALLAIGVVLLIFAYRASNAPLDQISAALTGRYSSQTMWYLILGIGGVIGGGLLFLTGSRR